jgi:hypothetical protein
MKDKGEILYNASTFRSSLLILTSLQLAKGTTVPLILAGFSGLIRAIPAFCPYEAAVVAT